MAYSVNSVPIRLTAERWYHIVENHDDVAGHYDDVLQTVEEPDLVVRGYKGALIAVRGAGRKEYFCVVYREINRDDGFIISAYFTSEINRRQIVWPSNH
ncbi:MAG: hypothetical protein HY782_12730 [Chloroflexi bacterium]|nr:hypothetical protein [Chloroflexota bacterium]